MFSLIGHEVYIYDALSHGLYIELFLVLRDIVDEYIAHACFDEILIGHDMLPRQLRQQ